MKFVIMVAAFQFWAGSSHSCGGDRYDRFAEVMTIKTNLLQLPEADPRKKVLSDLVAKIEIPSASLSLKGRQLQSIYRSEAMNILDLKRVPRWPEDIEAGLRSSGDAVGLAALEQARALWKDQRHDEAFSILNQAASAAGKHIVPQPRC